VFLFPFAAKRKEIGQLKSEHAMMEARYAEAVSMPAEPDWKDLDKGKVFAEFIAEVEKVYKAEASAAAKKPSEEELITLQAAAIQRAHAVAKDEVALFEKVQNETWKVAKRAVSHLEADEWMYNELEAGKNVYIEEMLARQPALRAAIDQEITDYNRTMDLEESTRKAATVIDVDGVEKIKATMAAKKAYDTYVKSKAT